MTDKSPPTTEALTTSEMLDALQDREAPPGHLGHAMRTSQSIINQIEPYTRTNQITGRLRHFPRDNINHIHILSHPLAIKDLAGEKINTPKQNKLAQWLDLERPKTFRKYKTNDTTHNFVYKHYRVTITTVHHINAIAVAQLLHTGPNAFVTWLTTTKSRSKGALPWGYHFTDDYHLTDNNKNKIKDLRQEKDVLKELGFNYIPIPTRRDGNKQIWNAYAIH